jgi:hypothetical protein
MAQELGVVFVMAAIVLAITTWAAAPNPDTDSVASIPPREIIYRAQHLHLN